MCWSSPFCLVSDDFFSTVLAHREPVCSWGVSLEGYTGIRELELLCRLLCRYWGSKVSTFPHWHLNPHNGILYSNKKKNTESPQFQGNECNLLSEGSQTQKGNHLSFSHTWNINLKMFVCVLYVCRLWTQKGGHGRGLRDLCGYREAHGIYAIGKQKQRETAKKGNQLEWREHMGRGLRETDQNRYKDTYIWRCYETQFFVC